MKKGILLLLLGSSVFVQAQSLKDALYGGKLKNDAGTVIRKGEDLSTKIDTTTHKATPAVDTAAKKSIVQSGTDTKETPAVNTNTTTATPANVSTENSTAAKDNNVVWKAYTDSVTSILKTEVLPSKKVKSGSYYVLVSYAIGTDGQITISDVFLSPENAYLQQQIKERLALDAPRLTPSLSSSGAPRKVNKKYNFTITKE